MSFSSAPRRSSRFALAAVLILVGGAAACSSDDSADTDSADTSTTVGADDTASAEPTVSDVWARAVSNLEAQDKSAIYLTIEGGDVANALVSASVPTDVATTVELHETVAADSTTDMGGTEMTTTIAMGGSDMTTTTAMGGDSSGMMTMQPVSRIEIPADGQVELKPGGYHIMLLDLQRELIPGETIEVTLTFEQGDPLTTTAEIRES